MIQTILDLFWSKFKINHRNEYTTSLKIIVDYCKICHNDFTKIFSLLECIN